MYEATKLVTGSYKRQPFEMNLRYKLTLSIMVKVQNETAFHLQFWLSS